MAKKKRRRKLKKGCARFFVAIILMILIYVAAVTLPFFNITSISVTGIKVLKAENVIKESQIEKGKNIFRSKLGKAEKNVKNIPYVRDADIEMIFPAGVKINITEETKAGYIVNGKKYIAINREGKVLETTEKPEAKIMQIKKLKVSSDKAGEKIEFENVNYFAILERAMNAICEGGLQGKVTFLDISNSSNIKIMLDNSLSVIMGGTAEMEYKIKLVSTVIANGYGDGVFNVSNPKQPTFRKN